MSEIIDLTAMDTSPRRTPAAVTTTGAAAADDVIETLEEPTYKRSSSRRSTNKKRKRSLAVTASVSTSASASAEVSDYVDGEDGKESIAKEEGEEDKIVEEGELVDDIEARPPAEVVKEARREKRRRKRERKSNKSSTDETDAGGGEKLGFDKKTSALFEEKEEEGETDGLLHFYIDVEGTAVPGSETMPLTIPDDEPAAPPNTRQVPGITQVESEPAVPGLLLPAHVSVLPSENNSIPITVEIIRAPTLDSDATDTIEYLDYDDGKASVFFTCYDN
jgi:hypothetical protein